MNQVESIVYNVVRKNPVLKQLVRNIYQSAFDLLPRKKEFFADSYDYREDYFFGFHDVSPFSQDETKLLANHPAFDLRMPQKGEGVEVGYFDFQNGKIGAFHTIGKSYAWNYHKGCRLQWLDAERVIFNTVVDGRLVSKIVEVNTGNEQVVNYPVDAVYTNGVKDWGTTLSYERLERCMPGYGYPYTDEGYIAEAAPAETGLFLQDLNTDERSLLVSTAQLAASVDDGCPNGYLHFVTHTEFSKDGRYIAFLYRRIPMKGDYMKRKTQVRVYDLLEQQLITLPTQESGSHYVWNNKDQLIISCVIDGNSCHVLYDMNDVDSYRVILGDTLNSDGHQSFISETEFVTDTYPDKYRIAKIYKANIETRTAELLLSAYSPKKFQTKDFKCHIACDLHPRVSPSGKYLCFDSPRTGKRGLYVMRL